MARRKDTKGSSQVRKDLMTIVVTTTPTYSADSRKIARAHAAAWSRKQQREERLKNERQSPSTACHKSPNAKSRNNADDTLPVSEARRRTLLASLCLAKQDQPRGSSNNTWPSPSPPITSQVDCADAATEEGLRTLDKGKDRVESHLVLLRELWKMDSGHPGCATLSRQLQTLALMPVPASAAYLDPFAASGVLIDGHMATLLRLYTHAILPRVRFHETISKACSNLAVLHALRHPMVLYAILCRASIQPRPEDGDPRDGSCMHQASVYRAGRRESIKFKLQAITYLNKRIGAAQLDDDHLPILHTISFLLRIETIHGNVQLVRAHLSGVQQLQTLGVRLDNYAYCSVAPIIHTIYFACAMTRAPPPFAPPVVSREKVLVRVRDKLEQCSDPELNLAACGFWTRPVIEALGLDFLALAAKRRTYTLFRQMSSNESTWPSAEELEYFTLAELSVDYHLLSMLFDSRPARLTPVQESVCLALLMFGHISSTSFEPASWWSWMRIMSEQLVEALERTGLADFWGQNSMLLLWVLFVGAHVFSGQSGRPWFVAQLARGIDIVALRSREEMRAVLAQFFYIELYFGKSLDDIWQEATGKDT